MLYNFKIWSSLFLASAIDDDDDECSVESLLFEAELLLDEDDDEDEDDEDDDNDEDDEDEGLNIFSHGRLIK